MFYNAGTLKTFIEAKTLIPEKFDDENMDDPVIKSLLVKGLKAPKRRYSQDFIPTENGLSVNIVDALVILQIGADCPCSKHRPQNFPQKTISENTNTSSQTPLFIPILALKLLSRNIFWSSIVRKNSSKIIFKVSKNISTLRQMIKLIHMKSLVNIQTFKRFSRCQ